MRLNRALELKTEEGVQDQDVAEVKEVVRNGQGGRRVQDRRRAGGFRTPEIAEDDVGGQLKLRQRQIAF